MSEEDKIFKMDCNYYWSSNMYSTPLFPLKERPEFAFLGRSNVGKSSLLNALTFRKKLVRTSKNPGQTRSVNFFNLGNKLTLVDMPGYGFASCSKTTQRDFLILIRKYIESRDTLRCLFLLIDSRRGIMDIDEFVLENLKNINFKIIYTKCDLNLQNQDSDKLTKDFLVSSKKNYGLSVVRQYIGSLV